MSKRWVVVDTNVFCLAGYQKAGIGDARERDYLYRGGEAFEFLHRMVEYCDVYGLAVDGDEGLIIEEYTQKIPRGSFGYYAFQQLAVRIPDKVRSFSPRNPNWVGQLDDSNKLDKHDLRFLATTLSTPDRTLVSEDSVFVNNADFLSGKGVWIYDVERANETL